MHQLLELQIDDPLEPARAGFEVPVIRSEELIEVFRRLERERKVARTERGLTDETRQSYGFD